jgi:hypothetical protein
MNENASLFSNAQIKIALKPRPLIETACVLNESRSKYGETKPSKHLGRKSKEIAGRLTRKN